MAVGTCYQQTFGASCTIKQSNKIVTQQTGKKNFFHTSLCIYFYDCLHNNAHINCMPHIPPGVVGGVFHISEFTLMYAPILMPFLIGHLVFCGFPCGSSQKLLGQGLIK